MELLSKRIRKVAAEHFPSEVVEDFVRTLSRWETDLSAHFYQVSHGEGKPVLEFGGIVGSAIVDLTAGSARKRICVFPIAAIQGIELIDKKNSTELFIRTAGTEDIRYHAVLDPERALLRVYALEIEGKLCGLAEKEKRISRSG
ncbi:MAG: hypothetical protein HYT87_03885 [Nitrospirae bacterium]|nr:hypothetical protein [Nitrospirota bacterium]